MVTIQELRPLMDIHYGFMRWTVAKAIAKREGTGHPPTAKQFAQASRVIKKAKDAGQIKCIRNAFRYYQFTDKDTRHD